MVSGGRWWQVVVGGGRWWQVVVGGGFTSQRQLLPHTTHDLLHVLHTAPWQQHVFGPSGIAERVSAAFVPELEVFVHLLLWCAQPPALGRLNPV